MKVAVQLNILPGKTLDDQVAWAVDHGVEGIELMGMNVVADDLYRQAEQIIDRVPVVAVCGNSTVDGVRSFDFLNPDAALRRRSIEGSKKMLEFCGEVGATGQIVPPIFRGPVVPNLSPVMDVLELEDALMVAALKELGPFAARHKTLFLLEPLNRYEQHYLRRQADGVRIIRKAKVKGVGLLSDLFHMHIEETSTPQALLDAGKHTAHLHLADNTRMEPGTGDIDLVAAFSALKTTGFKGYMSYECGISGNTARKRAENLAKSLDYVRSCIGKARKRSRK